MFTLALACGRLAVADEVACTSDDEIGSACNNQACACGWCEDPFNCPRCKAQFVCVYDSDGMFSGTVTGTCRPSSQYESSPRCETTNGEWVDVGETYQEDCNMCNCVEVNGEAFGACTEMMCECQGGEVDNSSPCNPRECVNGEWVEIAIDCMPFCEAGFLFVPPGDDECCGSCVQPCIEGEVDDSNPCNIFECLEGEWVEMMIDCAWECEDGDDFVDPGDGECCGTCVPSSSKSVVSSAVDTMGGLNNILIGAIVCFAMFTLLATVIVVRNRSRGEEVHAVAVVVSDLSTLKKIDEDNIVIPTGDLIADSIDRPV